MALQHTRSHSFPSKSQPSIIQIDENLLLSKLATTPSSLPSLTNRIHGLSNLHESIDELLLQPRIQRIITHECHEKRVDEILEGYIMLLDACSSAKDLVSLAKRDAQELLSGMRRRTHADAACSTYITSTRDLQKMARKSLKTSATGKKHVLDKGDGTSPVENLLMDAKSATLGMLSSLFQYMMGTNRSLVSKIMESRKVHEETEFTKVDAALITFMQRKAKNGDDVEVDDLLNCLKKMESSIRSVEDELECLFRRLIKTRVLLLNILSH